MRESKAASWGAAGMRARGARAGSCGGGGRVGAAGRIWRGAGGGGVRAGRGGGEGSLFSLSSWAAPGGGAGLTSYAGFSLTQASTGVKGSRLLCGLR